MTNHLAANEHEGFLRRAIELSRRASLEYCTGGVFGAVIVKDGKIVSEGMNRVVASHDPTWHAEMEPIRSASVTLLLTPGTPGASGNAGNERGSETERRSERVRARESEAWAANETYGTYATYGVWRPIRSL